jgi:radical SAM superfamily enzyme YgiQ (UPF0313 family)
MAFEEDLHYLDGYGSRDSRFPFGVIVGGRGCPYRCGFCCSPGRRRVHSAHYVFAQIIELNNRYGIRSFVFFDTLFTTAGVGEQRRVEDLCKMILCCGLDIRYVVEMRADVILQLPERLLVLMMRSGCAEFNLGLEKGSDRMLQKMTKDITVNDHFAAIEKLRRVAQRVKKEIKVNGTFILGGPGETKGDVWDAVIQSLALNLDEVTMYPLEIYPGTQVYAEALKEGILKPGLAPYLDAREYPLYATKNLPRSYLFKIKGSYDEMFESFRQLRGTMQEIEGQFLPEDERCLSIFLVKRTRNLDRKIREFIQAALEHLRKHPDGGLSKNGAMMDPVTVHVLKVERAIDLLEHRLKQKYPNYDDDYVCGDYQLGWLLSEWKSFLNQFEKLFSIRNFPNR